jgi:hypothetical protein
VAGNFFLVVLFIAGLAIGPGQYLWATLGGGQVMGGHEIQEQGNAYKPITLTLIPEMNPIGMTVRANRYGSKADKPAQLRVVVGNGQAQLADETVTFPKGGDKEGDSKRAGRFSVPRNGVYTFQITGTRRGEPGAVDLRQPTLELRRNMRSVNMKLVWAGSAAMVAALLLLGWSALQGRKN